MLTFILAALKLPPYTCPPAPLPHTQPGIESPGLTSSLALAEHVCRVLDVQ